jgi:hypothetical protein
MQIERSRRSVSYIAYPDLRFVSVSERVVSQSKMNKLATQPRMSRGSRFRVFGLLVVLRFIFHFRTNQKMLFKFLHLHLQSVHSKRFTPFLSQIDNCSTTKEKAYF